eukprot:TRINITY_DN17019_c0_g1_i2.p1 TRINITY_DN17019_c0_g1~~TRINITY_DN17019_c0_g1_i2.p1  ORF type:complete len:488 (-),score=126.12 TRINITY_DN17019_c0_g1_i2:175-1638(-)
MCIRDSLLVHGSDSDRETFAEHGGLNAAVEIIQSDSPPTEQNMAVDALCQLTRTPTMCERMSARELPLVAQLLRRLCDQPAPEQALLLSCARLLGNCAQAELLTSHVVIRGMMAEAAMLSSCQQLLQPSSHCGPGGATVTTHALRVLHAVTTLSAESLASVAQLPGLTDRSVFQWLPRHQQCRLEAEWTVRLLSEALKSQQYASGFSDTTEALSLGSAVLQVAVAVPSVAEAAVCGGLKLLRCAVAAGLSKDAPVLQGFIPQVLRAASSGELSLLAGCITMCSLLIHEKLMPMLEPALLLLPHVQLVLQRLPDHPEAHPASQAELILFTLQRWLAAPQTEPAARNQLAAALVKVLTLRLSTLFGGALCAPAVALVNTMAASVEANELKLKMARCAPLVEGLVRVALCSSASSEIQKVASATVRYLASINPHAQVQSHQKAFKMAIVPDKSQEDVGSFVAFSFDESQLVVSPSLLVKAHTMFAASPGE